jgi:hypothetical protein
VGSASDYSASGLSTPAETGRRVAGLRAALAADGVEAGRGRTTEQRLFEL